MSARTLVVDDSLTVRMDLAEAFEAAGFEVTLCASVAEARAALTRRLPDIIVLDVLLPDGDGIQLLRELRMQSGTESIPVLMLSTEAEVRDRVRALQVGADEYVGKPYDRNYVIAKARELTRAGQAARSRGQSILIIDDSVTFREALREAVTGAGYEPLTAPTGEDGLRIASSERPTAIIVDGDLPGIDGATVIRRIRLDAALRGTPCLLLTASDDSGAELKAFEAGADAFVRKGDDVQIVLARLAALVRTAAAPAEPATASLLGPRKILAVDDSPTYLEAIAETLRDDGYDVVLARSGEEALELLAVQKVDCILLDLLMPGLGGQETCRRIKAAPTVRDIPLVMLTSREDRAAVIEGLAAGADDYIPKSSELAVLKSRVRAQMRRKQFEDENRSIRERLLRKEFEASEARAASKLAEARAALSEELELKNQELEAFSYSVSHDLRAPLRSIDGFSRALEEDFTDKLDDKGRDYLRRMRASARRMTELIDDLLELSKVSRVELRKQRVDLSALAQVVVAELQHRDPHRTVEIAIAPGLELQGDPGLVRTMLENLIGNAWKFTAKSPAGRIEVGTVENDGQQAFFVRDNGAGFDPVHASRLFRPFTRLHAVKEFEGTGIGLATVARIVTRHGGRVWAEGSVGKGATIYFAL
jgi:DNA-binding response OmpR family regulator